jgi:hypothetical protein
MPDEVSFAVLNTDVRAVLERARAACNTHFRKSCGTLFPRRNRNLAAQPLFNPTDPAARRRQQKASGSRAGYRRNVMKITRTLTLTAAMAVAALGFGSSSAHAARVGVGFYVGGPAAYVPPSPGPGYEWVAGNYDGGYWVPGRWAFMGGPAYYGGYYGRAYIGRGGDRDDFHGDRDRGGDHFRGSDRGHGGGHDRR